MAFRIILPLTESYDEALLLAQLPTLESRREYLCKEYMSKMKKKDHSLHFMLQKPKMNEHRYSQRSGYNDTVVFGNTTKCRTIR